jgi:type I restriction-modification system DNA methylase subunit
MALTAKLITNKDDLKEHIHSIHNYMRNNGVGYGFDALNTFNLIYGLKLLEDLIKSGKLDKILSEDEKKSLLFSKLVKLADKADDDKLYEKIDVAICDILTKHDELKDVFFYEIPKDLKSEVIRNIVEKINQIDTKDNHHLAGKVYEYFIGRDATAISSLGAYYTDRWITKFIMDVLEQNNKFNIGKNGKIQSFCDPFGGSGGFTLSYIEHVINHAKNKKININWEEEICKINHSDLSNNVIKMAKLEIFTLTHTFAKRDCVKKCNSFQNEFGTFDFVLSNPPYGGDKKEEKVMIQNCSDQIKKYAMKDLDVSKLKEDKKSGAIKNYPLGGDNKENAGCLLFLSMLKKNGICVAVLKEGVFFDGKFEKLRKEMIDNYNVFKIVDISGDAFENTTTKTSILFLENSGKTVKTVFSKLIIDKDKKGEITGVHEEFIDMGNFDKNKKKIIDGVVEYKRLVEKKYSLSYKKYAFVKEECSNEFEFVKLGDICNFLHKSKRKASEGSEKGDFKFFTSSDNVKYCNLPDYNEQNGCVILGSGGNSSLHYSKQFSCSSDNILLVSNNEIQISTQYLYFALYCEQSRLKEQMNGSTIKHLTKEMLKEFKIPVPKSTEKMLEWVERIDGQYNVMTNGKALLKQLEKNVQFEINDLCRKNACDEKLISEICKIQGGKVINKQKLIDGIYPVIGGGKSPMGYHNEHNREKNITLISSSGNSAGYVSKYNIPVWASDCLSVETKDKLYLTNDYLHYYLCSMQNDIYNLIKGKYTCQPHFYREHLGEIIIKIPKDKKLIESLDSQFQLIELLKNNISLCEQKYKSLLTELSKMIEKKDNKDSEKQKKDSESDEKPKKKEKIKKSTKKEESSSDNDESSDENDESSSDNDKSEKNKKVKNSVKKEEATNDKNGKAKKKVSKEDSESNDAKKPKKKEKAKQGVKKDESSSDSESEASCSSHDSDEEYVWNYSVLDKMKKYKDDKDKLKELMTKNKIPKDIFNEKIKELQKKK